MFFLIVPSESLFPLSNYRIYIYSDNFGAPPALSCGDGAAAHKLNVPNPRNHLPIPILWEPQTLGESWAT